MITLDSDDTAIEVAKKEMHKLRNVFRDQLQQRLEARKVEEDDDGNKTFIEPPDTKWYLKEYRETLKVESQLEAETKRDEAKMVRCVIQLIIKNH